MKARIYKSAKREFECRLEDDGQMIMAKALGKLLKGEDSLVVGDLVEIEKIPETNEWQIIKLEPRSSEIFRISMRETKKKVTAANCKYIVILSSTSKPTYKQGIVDRFLVRAHQWGIEPLVVFNKMDEYDPECLDIEFEARRLEWLGVQCFEISAKDESYQTKFLKNGIADLKEKLNGCISVFLGKSGVGKSHTITTLSDGQANLKTKTVRKVGKGSHTTTWSEMVDCGSFLTIDSPGIRTFSLEDVDPEELISFFPDLEDKAVHCKFNNCSHEQSDKGCVFWSEYGEEHEFHDFIHSRLYSYLRLRDEISETPFWKRKYS